MKYKIQYSHGWIKNPYDKYFGSAFEKNALKHNNLKLVAKSIRICKNRQSSEHLYKIRIYE